MDAPLRLLLHWCLTLPVLGSALYCTVFTLRTCVAEGDHLLLVLLYPGCFLLWGCVACALVGLLKQTELEVILWRAS